jgi:dihydroxyacid dehydratase/phosphogluconate dehydratase
MATTITNSNNNALRAYSSLVVDGADRAGSRAMLHAVGFSSQDFKKPQIGIASTCRCFHLYSKPSLTPNFCDT